jgi:hypothetical protein
MGCACRPWALRAVARPCSQKLTRPSTFSSHSRSDTGTAHGTVSRRRGIPFEASLPTFAAAGAAAISSASSLHRQRPWRATPGRSAAAAPMADRKRSVAETFSRLREQGKARAPYALTFASRYDLEGAMRAAADVLCVSGEGGRRSRAILVLFLPFLEEQAKNCCLRCIV